MGTSYRIIQTEHPPLCQMVQCHALLYSSVQYVCIPEREEGSRPVDFKKLTTSNRLKENESRDFWPVIFFRHINNPPIATCHKVGPYDIVALSLKLSRVPSSAKWVSILKLNTVVVPTTASTVYTQSMQICKPNIRMLSTLCSVHTICIANMTTSPMWWRPRSAGQHPGNGTLSLASPGTRVEWFSTFGDLQNWTHSGDQVYFYELNFKNRQIRPCKVFFSSRNHRNLKKINLFLEN